MTCGAVMACGRPDQHRGHHGGFRPLMVPAALSEREVECLRRYAATGSQSGTAAAMGLSVQTVKNHLTNIYGKLDVGGHIDAFRAMGWLA